MSPDHIRAGAYNRDIDKRLARIWSGYARLIRTLMTSKPAVKQSSSQHLSEIPGKCILFIHESSIVLVNIQCYIKSYDKIHPVCKKRGQVGIMCLSSTCN